MSFLTVVRTEIEFRLKNWPQNIDRRFFAILRLPFTLLLSSKKITPHKSLNRSRRKRETRRDSPFKRAGDCTF